MSDITLYTGEQEATFSVEQVAALNQPLDPRLVSKRKGGFGRMLSYIEGHDAIDQANRIFGYGNWCYHPVSVEQVVLLDPLSGEAVGIEYKAQVELQVKGAIGPIVDIGSQPVATWNVEDQIMQRRLKAANGGAVNESAFTLIEKREARAVIVDAHEMAKKGAVTDALKRALRAYGNQFGNGLYGDGHVDISEPVPTRIVDVTPKPAQRQITAPAHDADKHVTATPVLASAKSGQSDSLLRMIDKAQKRVAALGLDWEEVKQAALSETVADAALEMKHFAFINGKITDIERKQKKAS